MIINGTAGDDDLNGTAEDDQIFAGAGNDTVHAGGGNNFVSGGDGNDTLIGGDLNDRLEGDAGDDFLDGGGAFNSAVYNLSASTTPVVFAGTLNAAGAASTQADGLGGTDTLVHIQSLEIYGGSAADHLTGSAAQDLLVGGAGDDVLTGGGDRDTFSFDTTRRDLGIDTITDLGRSDRITLDNFVFADAPTAGDGTAVARGQVQFGAWDAASNTTRVFVGADDVAGADLTIALTGQFTAADFSRAIIFPGVPHSDLILNGPLALQGTAGSDTLTGGSSNDTLIGREGDDTLFGNAGDDTLYGGIGNDRLFGGAGNDLLDGGVSPGEITNGIIPDPGWNAAVYDFSAFTTSVRFPDWPIGFNPNKFATNTMPDGLGGTDTLVNIAQLEVYGGSAADTLNGYHYFALLEGNGGDDSIDALGGNDTIAFDAARSDLGTDTIGGFGFQDRILLRNFQFTGAVTSGDGTSVLKGEVQFGAYDAAHFQTRVWVGTDDVAGADLSFILSGDPYTPDQFSRISAGSDSYLLMDGGASEPPPPPPPQDPPQTLTGTAAADTLTGGTGNDTIAGAAGNDILDGSGGDDTISGDAGNDKLFGGDGNDHVFGNAGKDRLEGGAGHDTLVGGIGDDMIWGDDGADWLQGDDGNDRLTGGAGDDTLVGGAGSDILIGNAGADTFWFQDGSGTDQVQFFFVSHHDRIRIDANVNGSGIQTAADAYAHTTDTADGALVDLGAGNSVLLVGVHADAISAAVFDVV